MPTVLDVSEEPVVLFGPIDPSKYFALWDVTEAATVLFGAVNGASQYEPVDITQRPVVLFGRGIIANVTVQPASVGPDVRFGAAQVDQSYTPYSIYPSSAVGTAKTAASVGPTGVGLVTVVGSPRRSDDLRPDGVSGSEAFGTPSTIATVLADSASTVTLFGEVSATKFGWVFRTPKNTYKWRLFKEYEGISLVKESGVWTEVAHPDLERTLSAQKYLPGGHDHVVSTSLKDELIGAGYTVTSEVVTTEDYET